MSVIFVILEIISLLFLLKIIHKDTDLNISFNKKDYVYILITQCLNNILILNIDSIYVAIFMSISLAFLSIAALIDKKTMLVYTFPTYIFIVLTVILDSFSRNQFSIKSLIVYSFPIIFGLLKAYGRGDIPMVMIIGGITYLETFNIEYSILIECVMIFITEIIFIIKAIIEKNMDGPFKLKEKRPLGPSILIATYIVILLREVMFL